MIDLLPWAITGIFLAIAVLVIYKDKGLKVTSKKKTLEHKKTTDEMEAIKKEIQKPLVDLPQIISDDPFGFEKDKEKK